MTETNIGNRLRNERERLNLSQTELATIGGITQNTQYLYESGKRAPNGIYLAAIAQIGIDVGYVLAGSKKLDVSITPTEIELVDAFRRSPRDVQIAVLSLVKATAI